jgi:hypothetical protein
MSRRPCACSRPCPAPAVGWVRPKAVTHRSLGGAIRSRYCAPRHRCVITGPDPVIHSASPDILARSRASGNSDEIPSCPSCFPSCSSCLDTKDTKGGHQGGTKDTKGLGGNHVLARIRPRKCRMDQAEGRNPPPRPTPLRPLKTRTTSCQRRLASLRTRRSSPTVHAGGLKISNRDLAQLLATNRGVQTPAQNCQAEADTRKLPQSASSKSL